MIDPATTFGNIFKTIGQRFGPAKEKRIPDIEESIPYIDAYDRFLIDIYGCVHAFYEILAPAADVASAERLTALQNMICSILEYCPDRIVQVQWHYATSGDYRSKLVEHAEYTSSWEIADALRQDRARELVEEIRDRRIIRSNTILVLSATPDDDFPLVASQLSDSGDRPFSLLKKAVTADEVAEAIRVIETAESLIEDSFKKVGIGWVQMGAPACADYLYRIFNQDMATDWGIPCNYDYNSNPFNDSWLCNDWLVGPYYIKIGEYYHTWISLNEKPQESSPRIIEKITTALGMNDIRVITSLRKLDRNIEADKLRHKRNLTLTRMREPLNWIERISNPSKQEDIRAAQYNVDARDEVDELNQAISDLRAGRDFLAQMQVCVHTWAKDIKELERRREIISARMSDMNKARAFPETHSTIKLFRTTLPGSVENLPRRNRVLGRMAADLVPLHRGFEGGDDPVCIFRNRTGGLVTINLFQQGVANAPLAFVSGGSGSGKSFLVNQILLQHLLGDALVIILDIGGSYADLLRLLGGQMISFEKGSHFRINPLQIYGGAGVLREPSPNDRRRMCRAMESLMIQPGDPSGIIPPAVLSTLSRGIEAAFNDAVTHGKNFVTLSDLYKIVYAYPDNGPETADRFKFFVGEELYGEFFDGPTTIDLRSPVVCFDLKGIRKDARLCAAITPIIVNYIHDLIGSARGRRKILVMDEMWDFLNNPRIMDFIIEAFKTFRKENTLTIGISQNLWSDIGSNQAVRGAIVQNTETWFLLHQGKEEVARNVAKMVNLTDGQFDLLKNLRQRADVEDGRPVNYRECLLVRASHSVGENSGVIRIQSNPVEYWIATTDPNETPLMAEAVDRFGGDTMAAARMLAEKYPGGISMQSRIERSRRA